MDSFLTFITYAGLGLMALNFILDRVIAKQKKDIDALNHDIVELAKEVDRVIPMRLEQVGDIVYAYNASNGQFLCQGKTQEEIFNVFAQRFPNKNGGIADAESDKIYKSLESKTPCA
jgi:hypothetical protein